MSVSVSLELSRGDFELAAELEAPARGVTAIFGPSGAGKTTLFRALAGLEGNAKGRVEVAGQTWQSIAQSRPPHLREVGYVQQDSGLFSHLNVEQNLRYGYRRVPAARRRVGFDDVTQWLGIEHLLERETQGLSGGERQRVAVARALLTSPRLLLLDEPLAALDRDSRLELLPALERLFRELEMPVFYVSHSAEEVARLADWLVLLGHGRVSAYGPIADMLTRLDLPLARGEEANALLEAKVATVDERFGLTGLDSAVGRITVARTGLVEGEAVRLRILAKDVSLTLERQTGTSILNIFPAEVAELVTEGTAQMQVRLLAGDVSLLARVTRKSTDSLGLRPGKRVFVQVKSVALLA